MFVSISTRKLLTDTDIVSLMYKCEITSGLDFELNSVVEDGCVE